MPEEIVCKICYSPLSIKHIFREMMFGMRDQFPYYECSDCGCLQIAAVPANIQSYYPPFYYSFHTKIPGLTKKKSGLGLLIQKFLLDKNERKWRKQALSYLLPTGISSHHKILDVGCGKGELICRLFNMGFEQINGTDKFLQQEINYGHSVKIMKKDLCDIESNSYDLIMMHHVLEHMFFPEEELKECFRILINKRFLIIRIPLKGFAWEKYKQDWVQLDAPRHFYIHTLKSMDILAQKSGFKMHNVVFDSKGFQFEASELYKMDIPLYDPETQELSSTKAHFNSTIRKFFRNEAKRLNREKTGDQAVFYFYKD